MNLVILYIIIYLFFYGLGEVFCELVQFYSHHLYLYVQAFANASRLAMCRGNSPLKNIIFIFPMKLISMTNDIRTLQTRKKYNVIYDLRFFIALRTSCRMVLCMSNKRVSFRRIFGYAEKIWIVSTANEGDKIYCRRCNWYLLWHRLIRMAAPPLLWMVIGPF